MLGLYRKLYLWLIILCCLWIPQLVQAGVSLEAVYPYSLEKKVIKEVPTGSTIPLYINLLTYDIPQTQQVNLTVELPDGFITSDVNGWQQDGNVVRNQWQIPANYDQTFSLVYLQPTTAVQSGTKKIKVNVQGQGWQESKMLTFMYNASLKEKTTVKKLTKKEQKKKFNWYIQSVTIPVDSQGQKDDRTANNTLYIRDLTLEGFRNRLTGDGATNWGAVFNHPAGYLLLDMRNPQQDVRTLRFKAELVNKATGELMPGLCTAGKTSDESEQGWAGASSNAQAATAMISLDGKKVQAFILPIYVDYFQVIEGDYTLRVTVSGNGQEKIQEVPLIIAQKNNVGLTVVIIAMGCFVIVLVFLKKIYRNIRSIGAKGAITIALFASIAFGGIALPTTLLGELLHVFLGPFSGLISGLLTGVFQYLLIVALLVLYRHPGVLALMLLVKFMLSGLLLGHFTPIGVLSCAVYVVFLESVLWLSGFYRQKELSAAFILTVSFCLGLTDAAITFINLEQLMFFYRLYYADWYIGLYMLINGFVYSSVGSLLGFRIGKKLEQVTGE